MVETEHAASTSSKFELLVQSVTDYAIYMLDVGGRVSSWNAGARRFKGYEPAEIIGQHFSRFYTPEERQREIPRIALETAAREGRFEAEGWRVRKDGSQFWANVVIDPIRDPTGELIGYAKVTRDLTERRAAEEELRASEQRFRLLVQSVTDYAIYMLVQRAASAAGTPARNASRDTLRTKLSDLTFPVSIRTKTAKPESQHGRLQRHDARDVSRRRAGEYVRTARASGQA